MELLLSIYSNLLLLFAGFVISILSILSTVFHEGINELEKKLEFTQSEAVQNLARVINTKRPTSLDFLKIDKEYRILKNIKNEADLQLSLLHPPSMVIKNLVPLGLSLSFLYLSIYSATENFFLVEGLASVAFILSILFLCFSARMFWKSLAIMIEASELVQLNRKKNEKKLLDNVSQLVRNASEDQDRPFINSKNVDIFFDNHSLSSKHTAIYSVNKKQTIPLMIENNDEKMLKIVELGFILPKETIMEKTYSISTITETDDNKIVRFAYDRIHSITSLKEKLEITFVKAGEYKVTAFVKGENLKEREFHFTIKTVA